MKQFTLRSLTLGAVLVTALGLSACQTTAVANNDAVNWVEVSGTQVENIHLFIDSNHIRPSTENPAWRDAFILNQEVEAQENSRSVVLSVTINCEQREMRVNEISAYTQPFAQGELAQQAPGQPDFFPAPPEDFVGNALVNAVCK